LLLGHTGGTKKPRTRRGQSLRLGTRVERVTCARYRGLPTSSTVGRSGAPLEVCHATMIFSISWRAGFSQCAAARNEIERPTKSGRCPWPCDCPLRKVLCGPRGSWPPKWFFGLAQCISELRAKVSNFSLAHCPKFAPSVPAARPFAYCGPNPDGADAGNSAACTDYPLIGNGDCGNPSAVR
jgi:hypothetical protein